MQRNNEYTQREAQHTAIHGKNSMHFYQTLLCFYRVDGKQAESLLGEQSLYTFLVRPSFSLGESYCVITSKQPDGQPDGFRHELICLTHTPNQDPRSRFVESLGIYLDKYYGTYKALVPEPLANKRKFELPSPLPITNENQHKAEEHKKNKKQVDENKYTLLQEDHALIYGKFSNLTFYRDIDCFHSVTEDEAAEKLSSQPTGTFLIRPATDKEVTEKLQQRIPHSSVKKNAPLHIKLPGIYAIINCLTDEGMTEELIRLHEEENGEQIIESKTGYLGRGLGEYLDAHFDSKKALVNLDNVDNGLTISQEALAKMLQLKVILSNSLANSNNTMKISVKEILSPDVITSLSSLISDLYSCLGKVVQPKDDTEQKSKGKERVKEEELDDNTFTLDKTQLNLLLNQLPNSQYEKLPKTLVHLYQLLASLSPILKEAHEGKVTNIELSTLSILISKLTALKQILITDLFGLKFLPPKTRNEHKEAIRNLKTIIERLNLYETSNLEENNYLQKSRLILKEVLHNINEEKIGSARQKIKQVSSLFEEWLEKLPDSLLWPVINHCKINLSELDVDLCYQPLPAEMIDHIGTFLPTKTLSNLSAVCFSFNTALQAKLNENKKLYSITQIVTGDAHTIVLMGDGAVYSCGKNYAGELGLGDIKNVDTLQKIPGLPPIKQVAAEANFSFFLSNEGLVWACGDNSYSHFGLEKGKYPVPIQVPLKNIKKIVTGPCHTFFLDKNGAIWCCGWNADARLGLGDNVSEQPVPIQLPGLFDITQIAAGTAHSVFLNKEGTAWICGGNSFGQLGVEEKLLIPSQIRGMADLSQIEASSHFTVLLKKDGTVWVCGQNYYGQLGLGVHRQGKNVLKLTQIPEISEVVKISVGLSHMVFLKKDGTVWVCGDNVRSQLGLSNIGSSPKPVQIPGLTNIIKISAGRFHTLFYQADGTILICGETNLKKTIDSSPTELKLPFFYKQVAEKEVISTTASSHKRKVEKLLNATTPESSTSSPVKRRRTCYQNKQASRKAETLQTTIEGQKLLANRQREKRWKAKKKKELQTLYDNYQAIHARYQSMRENFSDCYSSGLTFLERLNTWQKELASLSSQVKNFQGLSSRVYLISCLVECQDNLTKVLDRYSELCQSCHGYFKTAMEALGKFEEALLLEIKRVSESNLTFFQTSSSSAKEHSSKRRRHSQEEEANVSESLPSNSSAKQ